MAKAPYLDLVLVKANVDNGKLVTKINMLGNILLEDTLSGEAVKIGKLPECYSFREKSSWNYDGTCRSCGKQVLSNYTNFCPACGADMRTR